MSVLVGKEAPDFTAAAENTVNAVVHVKNVTLSSGQMTFQDFFYGRRSQQPPPLVVLLLP